METRSSITPHRAEKRQPDAELVDERPTGFSQIGPSLLELAPRDHPSTW
jgi:hypothetical protein